MILYHPQSTMACSLVEQVMSPETCTASVLDTNNNQMMTIMSSRWMIIGDITTGKRAEEEEGDFPEEEGALEGGEDASLILFIPTNKTTSKKAEMVKQMPQAKLLLYLNHRLLQVIFQVEEVLEVVAVAVGGLWMEEVEQVEQMWQK